MLTNDQNYVFKKVMDRLGVSLSKSNILPDFKYITIGGLAGTGKTFLISIIRNEIEDKFKNTNVAFATFTGKASSVLKSKLVENNAIFEGDFVGTIHSLIYKPELRYDKNIHKMVVINWIKKDFIPYDLIFIDEASMVNREIWRDLIEYEIPIIAVGDHGQLPPVGEQFNLMKKPDYLLTEIMRQALDNPIIRLSQDIRNGKDIPMGFYDKNNKGIFKISWNSKECKQIFDNLNFVDEDMIILCGLNKTRVSVNQLIRDKLGFINPEPYPGERVIFLKNNYNSKVFNGMIGKNLFLLYEAKNIYNMTIELDNTEGTYSGLVYNGCFGKEQYQDSLSMLPELIKKNKKTMKNVNTNTIDVCDFGYCISVHKSQGSEFKKVICFLEKSYYWDDEYMKKWLYTACTRAKEKLMLIV